MKTRRVQCDKCKHEFNIKKIQKKKHKDGLEGELTIRYFSCPKCKKKYVTLITNTTDQERINKRKELAATISNIKDVEEIDQASKALNKLDSKIESRAHRLKFCFSKYV